MAASEELKVPIRTEEEFEQQMKELREFRKQYVGKCVSTTHTFPASTFVQYCKQFLTEFSEFKAEYKGNEVSITIPMGV